METIVCRFDSCLPSQKKREIGGVQNSYFADNDGVTGSSPVIWANAQV